MKHYCAKCEAVLETETFDYSYRNKMDVRFVVKPCGFCLDIIKRLSRAVIEAEYGEPREQAIKALEEFLK